MDDADLAQTITERMAGAFYHIPGLRFRHKKAHQLRKQWRAYQQSLNRSE